MDPILSIELYFEEDCDLVIHKWEQGKLSDKEADEQLNALNNNCRKAIRVACGLKPEPEYHD